MNRPAADPRPVLQIAAANVVTALGNDAHTTAAAWVSQRRGQKLVQVGEAQLYTAPVADITQGSAGAERIQRLLDAAVGKLGAVLADSETVAAGWPVECWLQLPAWLSAEQQRGLAEQTCTRLAAQTQGALQFVHEPVENAMAAYQRLALIFQRLQLQAQQRGWQEALQKRLVLIGVDSRCEPTQLRQAHAQGSAGHTHDRKLDTAGEAAAYVALIPRFDIRGVPAGALALHPPAMTPPAEAPRWPSALQGDGRLLQQALSQALQQAGLALNNIGLLIDNNEDQPWRNEDQYAAIEYIHHTQGVPWVASKLDCADRLGQLGAATGVVHWALVQALHQHRLLSVSTALSVVQERSGACAAAVLERAK